MAEIDRRQYSENELRNLAEQGQLPGFLSPATFGTELFDNSAWQPVHNMTIVQFDQGGPWAPGGSLSVRALIRRAETNLTHPNVVSTPTRRMSTATARQLITERGRFLRHSSQPTFELTEVNPSQPQTIASFEPNPTALRHSDSLPVMARELLEAKLGLRDLTDDEQTLWTGIGKASLSQVIAGFSYVGDTEEEDILYEPIVMFGSVLSSGLFPLPLPVETNDYRGARWTPLGKFAKNVRERNVAELVVASEEDEVLTCVRGLCIESGVRAIANFDDLLRHTGLEGPDSMRQVWDPSLLANTVTFL